MVLVRAVLINNAILALRSIETTHTSPISETEPDCLMGVVHAEGWPRNAIVALGICWHAWRGCRGSALGGADLIWICHVCCSRVGRVGRVACFATDRCSIRMAG